MKISEVSLSVIKAHCGVSGNDSDELLKVYLEAAKRLAADYTGFSEEQLDEFPDITVACLNMVNEMYSRIPAADTGYAFGELSVGGRDVF